MQLVFIYLLTVNALGFLLMLADKYKARKNLWRIPEATLITVAVIGGSIGCLAGMYTFRHKTRHLKFSVKKLQTHPQCGWVSDYINCFAFFRISEKQIQDHFAPGRVPGTKYISGCKCGSCAP